MGKKITAILSDRGEIYFDELLFTVDVPGKDHASNSDVINWCLETLSTLEKVLERVHNNSDPVEFIKGVAEGTLRIVPINPFFAPDECSCPDPENRIDVNCPIHGRKGYTDLDKPKRR